MRTAVVLFNLGGPDSLAAVQPFLRNLFSDPAILSVPGPLRWVLARLISSRRAPLAREIYSQIGGRSPLRELTEAQAQALETKLNGRGGDDTWKVVVAMRYWHPFADEAARSVASFAPDRIVLLPLYPQYSGTTTGSSLQDWQQAAASVGLCVPTVTVCCYPDHPTYVAALTAQLRRVLQEAGAKGPFRVLFSAHGLPKKVIRAGDPYQAQVERSVAAVLAALGGDGQGLDTQICYQSRVGPLEWIGPATDTEIRRAGAEGKGLVILPIAFVSEHSETLVELDIEYRHLATNSSAPFYLRVPALGTDPDFITALAELAETALRRDLAIGSGHGDGGRICPPGCRRCALAA